MKKGISLVALIVTIIVLIILTLAVIWTSGDTPEQAKLAIFYNDVTVIQEAVTTKSLTNYVDASVANSGETAGVLKWKGIVSNTKVDGENVNEVVDADLYYFQAGSGKVLGLNLTDEKMAEFCIDPATGTVYHIQGVRAKQVVGDAEQDVAIFNRTETDTDDSVVKAAIAITSYSLGNNYGASTTLTSSDDYSGKASE